MLCLRATFLALLASCGGDPVPASDAGRDASMRRDSSIVRDAGRDARSSPRDAWVETCDPSAGPCIPSDLRAHVGYDWDNRVDADGNGTLESHWHLGAGGGVCTIALYRTETDALVWTASIESCAAV